MKSKGFFQSKTVILALVNLLLAVLGGLTHKELTYLGSEIVALDWAHVTQAVVSLLLIFVRVYFGTGSRILGLFKSPATMTYLIALFLLGSAGSLLAAPHQPYRAWQWQNRPAEIGTIAYQYCLYPSKSCMGFFGKPKASAKEWGPLFPVPVK